MSWKCKCGAEGFVDISPESNPYPCKKCYQELRRKEHEEGILNAVPANRASRVHTD